ncbi:MAG: YfhO family protein [Thermoanaerobaculia bacterium]
MPGLRLLLLLGIAAGGFLAFGRARREGGIAWLLACGVATALLAPSLLVPHGIPSPSANLSRLAPWQTSASPPSPLSAASPPSPARATAGNPELGDVTFQVEPWLLFLRTEFRAGRLPFWDPYQSSGAPYWSNGSSAPLFPLHLLFALLPIDLGFLLLPWIRIVAGALGTYFLARELGIGVAGARLSAVIYPLSGRLVSFLLFPMANALCLVPWIFLAVERLANGKRAWTLLAVLAGLQLLAGHPETAFFTAAACGVYLLGRGFGRGAAALEMKAMRVWGEVVSAWIVGLLLAGVALVPLAFTLPATDRWREWTGGGEASLPVIFRLWLRFVLPNAFGELADGSFWGPYLFVPTTVYAGALTLPLAIAALFRRRRAGANPVALENDPALAVKLRALACMALVCLLASYHFPGFRELLFATPIVQKMLHHYLLLGVELGLALLAGAGLERWLAGEGRGLVAGALLPLLAVVAGWAAFRDDWQVRGQTSTELAATALALGLPLLLIAALRLSARSRRRLAPWILCIAVADLVWAHRLINPVLPVEKLQARTPAIEFLAGRPERIAAIGDAFRPNAAMVHGLYDVRGDDSLKLSRYEKVYGSELATPHPTFFRAITNWTSPWLDRLGVRWVLAAPGTAPPVASWTAVYSGADATIFERATAEPLVRFERAPQVDLPALALRLPGRWEFEWRGAEALDSPRLVVAETWDPGWRATLDGRPLVVEAADDLWLSVRPGAGSGRLVLRYLPDGIVPGLWASALGLVLLVAAAIISGRPGWPGRIRARWP